MNILIAIPCYGGNVSNLTFHSILNTLRWLNDQGHNIRVETLPTESLINRARNKFVTKFLDNKEFNGTHLLFIDADIGFTIDNLKRIIDFNKDVVTCTYPVKGFYWQQLLDRIKKNTNIDEKLMRDYLLQFNVNLYPNTEFRDGFARVKESATGFMMIKREVFTAIMDKNPQLKYKPDLTVGIYREKDGVNRFLSEDYYFCRLAEECGFEIWTDLSTPINHLGSTEYYGKFIDQINRK